MVLLWNKKMMSPSTDEPVSPGQNSEADTVYENAGVEQATINQFTGNVSMNANSLTLNLVNYLSDFDAVAGTAIYRTSEKESKGAVNLENGKPRYYPAAYVEAMKETAAEEESDEPVDPPTDTDTTE
jgi:hypothetical protein